MSSSVPTSMSSSSPTPDIYVVFDRKDCPYLHKVPPGANVEFTFTTPTIPGDSDPESETSDLDEDVASVTSAAEVKHRAGLTTFFSSIQKKDGDAPKFCDSAPTAILNSTVDGVGNWLFAETSPDEHPSEKHEEWLLSYQKLKAEMTRRGITWEGDAEDFVEVAQVMKEFIESLNLKWDEGELLKFRESRTAATSSAQASHLSGCTAM